MMGAVVVGSMLAFYGLCAFVAAHRQWLEAQQRHAQALELEARCRVYNRAVMDYDEALREALALAEYGARAEAWDMLKDATDKLAACQPYEAH